MSGTSTAASRIPGTLLRYWWLIFVAAVVGGMVAFAWSASRTPIFHSTASTYFSIRSGSSGSDINQGSTYTQNQMLSFAQLAHSAAVLDGVREDLAQQDLEFSNVELRRMVSVAIPQNTVVLDVTVGTESAGVAAFVANAIAEHLSEVVSAIAPVGVDGEATVVARVIEPATPAVFQSSPNKARDAVLGATAGGFAAILGLVIWTLTDARVRSRDSLALVSDLPLLGTVPRQRGKSSQGLALLANLNGQTAEAYRQLRSALKFSAVEHAIDAIAVTSSVAGEGKTTTAVNIALAYVESGQSVLIVDADLRRPRVAEVLGVENSVGLTTVLVGSSEIDEAVLTHASGLRVLTAGDQAPNPAQLLASAAMSELVSELRERFDVVIIDTAPLLSVADATIMSQYVDSTIVVVNARRTRRAQLERCIGALRSVNADLAGFVLNNVRPIKSDGYYYTAENS